MSNSLREIMNAGEGGGALLSNIEYVHVFHAETGEPVTLPIQYKGMLLKLFPADYPNPKLRGKRVFTSKQMVKPKRGTAMCRLHPDSPSHQWIEEIGLGHLQCFAASFPNAWEVDNHMRSKHHQEGQRIIEAEQKLERERDHADQMAQLEVIKALAGRTSG